MCLAQPFDIRGVQNEWLDGAMKQLDQHGLSDPTCLSAVRSRATRQRPFRYSGSAHTRNSLFGLKALDRTRTRWQIPETCQLCRKPFEDGDTFDHTLIVTHCFHVFHLKCLIKYWDQPQRYLKMCPTCKVMPDLHHERVGIRPGNDEPAFDASSSTFVYDLTGRQLEADREARRADDPPVGQYNDSQMAPFRRRNFYDIETSADIPYVSSLVLLLLDATIARKRNRTFDVHLNFNNPFFAVSCVLRH